MQRYIKTFKTGGIILNTSECYFNKQLRIFIFLNNINLRKKQAAARLAMSTAKFVPSAEKAKGIELQVLNANAVENKQPQGRLSRAPVI